jgi:hypothetical protein
VHPLRTGRPDQVSSARALFSISGKDTRALSRRFFWCNPFYGLTFVRFFSFSHCILKLFKDILTINII